MTAVACVQRKYTIPDLSDEIYEFIGAPTAYDHNPNSPIDALCLDWTANEAARDFYHNHDGWENKWPVTIRLLNSQNESIAEFIVDMELEPTFHAKRK